MKIPVRGPGRPRKWKGPTDVITLRLPLEIIKSIDDIAAETGKSRTDVIVSLVKAASNVQVAKLLLRIDSLEEYIKQLEKERQDLLEEREKLLDRIEKLQLQIQALKLGSKTVVRDAIKLKAIAEKIEEGKSWKEVCALAGFRDEDKIRDYLKMAFDIRRNDRDEWPEVFKSKDIVEEFQGWVLVKEIVTS